MLSGFITLFENNIISDSKVKCSEDHTNQHRNHQHELQRARLKRREVIWLSINLCFDLTHALSVARRLRDGLCALRGAAWVEATGCETSHRTPMRGCSRRNWRCRFAASSERKDGHKRKRPGQWVWISRRCRTFCVVVLPASQLTAF